jgi:hypothetical protein
VARPHTLQTVRPEQRPQRERVAHAGAHPAVGRQQLGGRLPPRKAGKGGPARRPEPAVSELVEREEDLGGPGIQRAVEPGGQVGVQAQQQEAAERDQGQT